jgi:biopolymer transport protein ExbD
MADIFTILLVFLLKSYASGSLGVSISRDVTLPVARGSDEDVQALKIEVSEQMIQVEGRPVVALQQFSYSPADVSETGALRPVERALASERGKQSVIASSNEDVKVDARVLVMADQRTPYRTLKAVLASAALQGFTDFKLVVVKDE